MLRARIGGVAAQVFQEICIVMSQVLKEKEIQIIIAYLKTTQISLIGVHLKKPQINKEYLWETLNFFLVVHVLIQLLI